MLMESINELSILSLQILNKDPSVEESLEISNPCDGKLMLCAAILLRASLCWCLDSRRGIRMINNTAVQISTF